MKLNLNEADFIMHCIELFVDNDPEASFLDAEKQEVVMDNTQITNLYLRIQEAKFASLN